MKIICDTTFLDGKDRFENGDQRTVDDVRGAYFIANGWAHEVGGEPAAPAVGDVTLDVHKSVLGQEVRNG
ncbi:MAG: hypothetical protein IT456_26165, partial [Planctomycetes bacterium]|jgi:hypothetical protein|nr:hypothetical protein [Planctomycetota bacterium]